MATKVQLAAGEELTVKANEASAAVGTPQAPKPAGAPTTIANKTGGDIAQEIIDKGKKLADRFNKMLMDAHQRKLQGASPEDVSLGGTTGLTWEIATAGPFNLTPPTPVLTPNRVIQAGTDVALMIGISYAADVLTQTWLAGKTYDAFFTEVNLTNVSSGLAGGSLSTGAEYPPGTLVIPGPAPTFQAGSPFHLFLYYFIPALTGGADQELYDINFTIDIDDSSAPGIPGAGFSNWNYDPYGSTGIPLGVPGEGPQWQRAVSGRFMVNDPNN